MAATARPIASAADDAQLLAAELAAEHEIERPAFPAVGANQPVSFGDPPGHAQNHRPGQLGDRFGQHIGRVGDDDAALPGGGDVDVVVAHGDVGHDLQRCAGIHDLTVDSVGENSDQGVLVGDALLQLLARNPAVAVVEIDVASLGQPGEHGGGNLSGQKNARTHQWP